MAEGCTSAYDAGWNAATDAALAIIATQIATFRSEHEEGWPVFDLQMVADAIREGADRG